MVPCAALSREVERREGVKKRLQIADVPLGRLGVLSLSNGEIGDHRPSCRSLLASDQENRGGAIANADRLQKLLQAGNGSAFVGAQKKAPRKWGAVFEQVPQRSL